MPYKGEPSFPIINENKKESSSCPQVACPWVSLLQIDPEWRKYHLSRVFLLRQLWNVNYYVKSSSNDLSNENINTGISREMIFQKYFILAF